MIAVGDISKWAKGAVGFKYPEPSNRPAKAPRNDVQLSYSLAHTKTPTEACVFVAGVESPKNGKAEITGEQVLSTVGFSNKACSVFESLVQRRFFT